MVIGGLGSYGSYMEVMEVIEVIEVMEVMEVVEVINIVPLRGIETKWNSAQPIAKSYRSSFPPSENVERPERT
jgi:hypothetical protein